MKSGDGEVKQGDASAPDVTLELADEDFVAMSTGKADPNKLYFGGKMKVSGNVMASQKLAFLQKIDPKLISEAPVAAPAAAPAPKAAAKPKSGRGNEIFAALEKNIATKKLNGLGGKVLQFNVRDPEASWLLDLRQEKPRVAPGMSEKADAVFGIADEDLVALVQGKAEVRDLYQRGKLRVDGDVKLAQQLTVLDKLI
jgi:3-hydroxyacyl-CoA dehydrogenase/3a,7a,12a-trihydroxy-5b-cholest-24-enoyl-CoA hydratase